MENFVEGSRLLLQKCQGLQEREFLLQKRSIAIEKNSFKNHFENECHMIQTEVISGILVLFSE
jgi:hypothetical protein